MPKRPLLIFPRSVPVEREKLSRSIILRTALGRRWQDSHVQQPLQQLHASLARRTVELSTTAPGAVAEEVLVLETIGNVTDFVGAVRRVTGLEWLVSFDAPEPDDEEENPPDEIQEDEFAQAGNRLFALATNAQALDQLLSLWQRFQSGQPLNHGFGAWKQVFAQLREVRRWSVKDRLHETGVVEFWRDALELGLPSIAFAAEFWFRAGASARRARFESLRTVAQSLGGTLEHPYEHEPTCFHAAVATFPPSAIRQFLDQPDTSEFLQRTEVMFCRPQGQTAVPLRQCPSSDFLRTCWKSPFVGSRKGRLPMQQPRPQSKW